MFTLLCLVSPWYGFGQFDQTKTHSPALFLPDIVSTKAFEFGGSFSPDARCFVFTRRSAYEAMDNRLFITCNLNGDWHYPEPVPFGLNCFEFEPAWTPDGSRIYFGSERPHPVTGQSMTNNERIWYAPASGNAFSDAVFLPGILNTLFVMNVAPVNADILYFCGEFGNQSGIFKAFAVNGSFDSIVFQFDGIHPWVSSDDSMVFYDQIVDGNWEKTAICFRRKTSLGTWGDEIRLPDDINATGTESHAFLSPCRKYLCFQRDGDIYWTDSTPVINH